MCEKDIPDTSLFSCYASTSATPASDTFTEGTTYVGYVSVSKFSVSYLATCQKNTFDSSDATLYTPGCAYKCQNEASLWLNHGDLTLDDFSDPSKTLANCASVSSSHYCFCLQQVDDDPVDYQQF